MASSSEFRFFQKTRLDIPTPSTSSNSSYFISSTPTVAEWKITTTPHPMILKWCSNPGGYASMSKKENQPPFDALRTLNSDEPKSKKRPYRARRTTTDEFVKSNTGCKLDSRRFPLLHTPEGMRVERNSIFYVCYKIFTRAVRAQDALLKKTK